MTRRGHLITALRDPGFRRLLGLRFACQFGDGVFQASLAGAVLFDPERQAHAADVAAGFAVLLLPYSVVGPFAGVLLDRWWRQRVAVVTNLIRAVVVLGAAVEIDGGLTGLPFYATALVVISLSRFVLSALSAALPRVVADADLVTANALSSTAGTMITAAGGAAAVGVRALIGNTNGDYALIAGAAIVPFLLAAGVAQGFARTALGPSDAERRARETFADVGRGLLAGARHVRALPPVANGLAAIGVHRLCFGIWTVCTVLLYRNYFSGSGFLRAGLTGLTQVVIAVAAGGAVAALVTPAAYRRFGPVRWPAAAFGAAAVIEVTCVLPYTKALLVLSALLLGFTSQAAKISVDTLIQHHVVDAFRGRVFAIYDTLFNIALVLAAVLTAVLLPEDGHSPASVAAIAAGWAATSVLYFMSSRRTTSAVR